VTGRWVDDAYCVASLDTDQLLELNHVGGRIWELACEGLRVRDIAAALAAEFDVDEETARRDAIELLAQLARDGMLLED